MRSQAHMNDHDNLDGWLGDLREKGTVTGLISIYGVGVLLAFSDELLGESLIRVWLPIVALAFAGMLAVLLRLWPRIARSLVIVSCATLTLLIVHPGGITAAAPLLSVAVLFAGILFTANVSLVVAGLLSILILCTPSTILPLPASTRVVTLMSLWCTAGLLCLLLHHLLWSIHWAWSGYHQSRAALERARDLQVQLYETMEDLAGANAQLTRLNQLANSLRRVAEEERQAKQQFVANVSHELRTPLNMIIGFSEMITESPHMYGTDISPKLLADLTVVLRNSQHLSELIDDVLDLSQVEAGMMALSKEHCSPAEIVHSAVLAIQPLFRSKQLSLDVSIAENLPLLYCDRTRIREVLLNLLSNAGRYTEQGGCTVRVAQKGDELAVSVTDTGPGIAPEDQERLFRPFTQIDGTLRRRYGGTGLGLSISKSFVELHGGHMSIESARGSGTTFRFTLPFETPPAAAPGALRWFNPHRPYEERSRPSRFHPKEVRTRLVVVENGDAMTRLLNRYMGDVEVVSVRTLEEARREATENPAQAILVNNLDVGSTLQSFGSGVTLPPGIPVMVCAIPAIEKAASIPGVSAYLVKPISRDQLLNALDELAAPVHTLLLIDDEPDALHLFRRMLASTERGYRVIRAGNAVRGLEVLASQRPDVILLDLTMPDMDGFGFLKAKDANPSWRNIPVILVSARDPLGHPIVSNALAVTTERGLSVRQLLGAIDNLMEVLSPTVTHEPAQPTTPRGLPASG